MGIIDHPSWNSGNYRDPDWRSLPRTPVLHAPMLNCVRSCSSAFSMQRNCHAACRGFSTRRFCALSCASRYVAIASTVCNGPCSKSIWPSSGWVSALQVHTACTRVASGLAISGSICSGGSARSSSSTLVPSDPLLVNNSIAADIIWRRFSSLHGRPLFTGVFSD